MRQHRVDEIPKRAWKRLPAGQGAKGERLYDWALARGAEQEGWEHTLLVRRSLDAKPEYSFYFTYAPKKKSALKTLVAVAGRHWAVEIAFQMGKGECGSDHYEVRHWQGWYRHIILSMLALAVLVLLRAREKKLLPTRSPSAYPKFGICSPCGCGCGCGAAGIVWNIFLHWSDWRRRHQFLASLCHYRKRGSLLPTT